MATVGAIHGLGESVVHHLRAAYALARNDEQALPASQRILPACGFEQIGTGQLPASFAPSGTQMTLLLYRIAVDQHTRGLVPERSAPTRPLPLELHYLVTAWSGTVEDEHTAMAWTMRELHRRPSLDRSMLIPAEAWDRDETVSIIAAELDEDGMRHVWDRLAPRYRLSVGYVARVVRLGDDRPGPDAGPVVAVRYALREMPENV